MAVAPKKKTKPSKVSVEAVPEVQAKSLVEIAIEKFSAAKDSMMTQLSPMLSNLFARKTMSPMKFTLPQNILVVGAGGTGGWFAPKIAKIVSDALNKRIVEHQVNVVFIDADNVEMKNLRRQNFVQPDVGRNKAEVIATRYNHSVTNQNMRMSFIAAYMVDKSYPIPEEKADQFVYIENVMANCKKESYLVINLIDNMASRKAIHKFCYHNGVDVIDVANNDYNGQLNYAAYKNGLGHIGSFFAVYPDAAKDNDMIVLENCADADVQATEQLFNANDMAATILGTFLANALADGVIPHHHVSFCTGSNMSITANHSFMSHNDHSTAPADYLEAAGATIGGYDQLVKAF